MKPTLIILAFLASGLVASTAAADGLPVVDVDVGPSGVTAPGEAVRYVALPADRDTLVARIERNGGRVVGFRRIRGRFTLPAVAYDGSAAGLSTDGRSLVLIAPRQGFPRRTTTFAVLDARTLKLRKTLTLRGDYSFDALSPDARWMYLIHYTSPKSPLAYEVRALDLGRGTLHAEPIVDPREPNEKMNGHPLTRATSRDGRWAYTLYEGAEHPFVHALDTTRRDARCIDLDWLHGRKGLWDLRFDLDDEGRRLLVRTPDGERVAAVDTRTFEASLPAAAGVGGGAWPKAGLAFVAVLLAATGLLYAVRARSRSAFS
jgi:hypothetical protein